jgi:hypothetical protein
MKNKQKCQPENMIQDKTINMTQKYHLPLEIRFYYDFLYKHSLTVLALPLRTVGVLSPFKNSTFLSFPLYGFFWQMFMTWFYHALSSNYFHSSILSVTILSP